MAARTFNAKWIISKAVSMTVHRLDISKNAIRAFLISLLTSASFAVSCDFDVTTFGARGDGQTDDTSAVTAAIAAAAACAGGLGGRVILPFLPLPSPSTYVCGALWLQSNVNLQVTSGATLSASDNFSAYPTVIKPSGFGAGPAALINGGRCEESDGTGGCSRWSKLRNVTLSGGGTINGRGHLWWWASMWWPSVPRPFLIEMQYVDGLIIQDLALRESALWTLVPSLSTNILIERITLDAGVPRDTMPYNGFNVDGLDSNNVVNMTMRDSWLFAGDDCVAINSRNINASAGDFATRNVTIGPNVTCRTPITIGSGTGIGVYDVRIVDSVVDARWGNRTAAWQPRWYHTALRFKSARNRGPAGVSGVVVSNITVLGASLAVDFQLWYSCQNSSGTAAYELCREMLWPTPLPRDQAPNYDNVHISGLRGDAWRPVWAECLPEHPCFNVTITDMDIAAEEPAWVCENIQGAAARVLPPAGECFLT